MTMLGPLCACGTDVVATGWKVCWKEFLGFLGIFSDEIFKIE